MRGEAGSLLAGAGAMYIFGKCCQHVSNIHLSGNGDHGQEVQVPSKDKLLNIIDYQGMVVKNMLMVLVAELYTLARGVKERMADKGEWLYMIGLCISLLNKSEKLFTVYVLG